MNQAEQERHILMELKEERNDLWERLETCEENLTRAKVTITQHVKEIQERDRISDKHDATVKSLRMQVNTLTAKLMRKKRQCKKLIRLFVKMSKTDDR